MEYGLLFRKTSTCYKHPDIEYLDENSDYRLRMKAKDLGVSVEELRQNNQETAQSISYLTKENHGRVYAGGYLRDGLLVKKGLAPEKWDNEVRKKAITAEVFKVSRKYGTYRGALGHKMVFSVSNEMADKIENSGLKLDNLLGREVKKIMYEFQNKFHPGEKIGFAWGIHHDTKHRHVHIYLCNRTNNGKHVALSNPLKGRVDKRSRKNQIGFIKERCVAAQKRMLDQAEKVNKNVLPKKLSDLKIEHSKPDTMADWLIEKSENLESMRQSLVAKENHLKLHQESIRHFYSDYYLRKDLVAQGWNSVRSINEHIKENYQSLRQNDTVVSNHLLRQLGMIPSFGYMNHFSKLFFAMNNAAEKRRREAIFQEINQSKEFKTRLVNQLRLLDWQQTYFQQRVKEMKEEREKLRKEFNKLRSRYDFHRLKFNYDFFLSVVKDEQKKEDYHQITKILWRKRRRREDSSEELAFLGKLDKEAREIIAGKTEEKEIKQTQEIVDNKPKLSIDNYVFKPKNDNDNQSRGMKF